ncbi:hypothetical protein M0R45_033692 [Rubus argutus]|uniref:Uncharacterized protein n=1 Tax=Rubus argutus TaxID=59490 RepID=A0AAW1WMJ7_RUBAR
MLLEMQASVLFVLEQANASSIDLCKFIPEQTPTTSNCVVGMKYRLVASFSVDGNEVVVITFSLMVFIINLPFQVFASLMPLSNSELVKILLPPVKILVVTSCTTVAYIKSEIRDHY